MSPSILGVFTSTSPSIFGGLISASAFPPNPNPNPPFFFFFFSSSSSESLSELLLLFFLSFLDPPNPNEGILISGKLISNPPSPLPSVSTLGASTLMSPPAPNPASKPPSTFGALISAPPPIPNPNPPEGISALGVVTFTSTSAEGDGTSACPPKPIDGILGTSIPNPPEFLASTSTLGASTLMSPPVPNPASKPPSTFGALISASPPIPNPNPPEGISALGVVTFISTSAEGDGTSACPPKPIVGILGR